MTITRGRTSTVRYQDADLDAFSRLRVGNPSPVFENKNNFGRNENFWEEETNGVGASISYLSDEASVQLQVGTASGEYAIRQTNRYFSYVPGKSQLITMTGVLGESKDDSKTNLTKRVGYFDDNNGLFFELSADIPYIVIRTSTSGSPVDNAVAQSEWNRDRLDGTGPSGITLDSAKAQIFVIDFQWLGTGRVRFGFSIDGNVIYCHEVLNANNAEEVYMSSPSLPLRYEIRNTGTTPSSSKIKEICCSIASEGGYTLPGLSYSRGNGVTTRAITTRTPILAIRLLNTFESKENRRVITFVNSRFYTTTNDAFFELALMHDPSSITATWSDVGDGSAAEYSTDITAVTGNPEHIVDSVFAVSGQGNTAGASLVDPRFQDLHSSASQNFDSTNSQMFVVYATSFSGTANVSAALTWVETD